MEKTTEDLEKISLKNHWFDIELSDQNTFEQVKVLAVYPTMIKVIDKEGSENYIMIRHIVALETYIEEDEKEFEKELKELLEE